jgi:preprotein translocase subunit SecD
MRSLFCMLVATLGAALFAMPSTTGGPTTQPQPAAPTSRLAYRLVAPVEDAEPGQAAIEMLTDPFTHVPIPVYRRVWLDETDIAKVGANLTDRAVYLEMTAGGASKLEKVTSENVGRRLGIILDGKILVAPTINTRVSKAVVVSLGPGQNDDDVRKLASELNALVKNASATRPASRP